MFVGTDVYVRMVFVWEETGVPGGNPPVWLGDHMPKPDIEPGSQRWEASVLPLRHPDSHEYITIDSMIHMSMHKIISSLPEQT